MRLGFFRCLFLCETRCMSFPSHIKCGTTFVWLLLLLPLPLLLLLVVVVLVLVLLLLLLWPSLHYSQKPFVLTSLTVGWVARVGWFWGSAKSSQLARMSYEAWIWDEKMRRFETFALLRWALVILGQPILGLFGSFLYFFGAALWQIQHTERSLEDLLQSFFTGSSYTTGARVRCWEVLTQKVCLKMIRGYHQSQGGRVRKAQN